VDTVVVIIVIVAVAALLALVFVTVRLWASSPSKAEPAEPAVDRFPAPLVSFHVRGEDAEVAFDVPLPDGDVDSVLGEILVREAIEVTREKRHHLPIDGVRRVVALARRGDEWVRVGSVPLDQPGSLPPPLPPVLLHRGGGFDPFESLADLPQHAPGLAARPTAEDLPPLHEEVRLPSAVESGLRTMGIDPSTAGAGDLVLGIMRLTGHHVDERSPTSFVVERAGETTFLRVVPHRAGEYPELGEDEIRRFAVDFVESKAARGLLVTEKYSPFEIYERERRDPRVRFVTRERLQHFVDALAIR
jgi:hypothetical protein